VVWLIEATTLRVSTFVEYLGPALVAAALSENIVAAFIASAIALTIAMALT